MRISAAAAVVALATFAAPACIDVVGSDFGQYVDREVRHFSTTGTPDLALSTFDGSIEIRAWDKPDVEVVIEKHASSKTAASAIQVDAQQTGNRVSVDVRRPTVTGFSIHFGSRSAKLIVSAPANVNVNARSGDGSIAAERLSGHIELRSGDGSIRGHNLTGDVKAHTGDGSIHLDGVGGALDVSTGDGSVAIESDATTPTADWNIRTGDGSVKLEVPEGFNGELDAHTGDGRVHLQDVTLSNVTGEIGRNSVRGRLGSGGRAVRLRSGDGSISITSRRARE